MDFSKFYVGTFIFDSDELIDLNQEVIKNEKDNKPF